MVAGEDFPGRALLPAPTEALVIDEGPITALCVLQVKLREKTQRIIMMAIVKKRLLICGGIQFNRCLYTVGLLLFILKNYKCEMNNCIRV